MSEPKYRQEHPRMTWRMKDEMPSMWFDALAEVAQSVEYSESEQERIQAIKDAREKGK